MSDLARALQEPWPDLRLQREGVGFGIWVFLASEVLFFAGLFITYAIYRSFNAQAFSDAGRAYGDLLWLAQYRDPADQQPDDDGRVARRERATAQLTLFCLAATAMLGVGFLAVQGPRISRRYRAKPHSGRHISRSRRQRPSCSGGSTGS